MLNPIPSDITRVGNNETASMGSLLMFAAIRLLHKSEVTQRTSPLQTFHFKHYTQRHDDFRIPRHHSVHHARSGNARRGSFFRNAIPHAPLRSTTSTLADISTLTDRGIDCKRLFSSSRKLLTSPPSYSASSVSRADHPQPARAVAAG